MEDSGRPIIGYPAPNRNPNRYSAHPPPARTGYPHLAGGSSANHPYYQQNYQADPDTIRRVLALIIGLVVVFAAVTFIVWLVLHPRLPQFRVDSLSLSNFTLGNASLLSFAAEALLTARNPNRKMTLSFDNIQVLVYYKSWSLSDAMIPAFSQGTKNETPLTASFAAAGSFVDKSAVDGINSERTSSGSVGFNLRILSRVRFKAKAWRTRKRFLKVFCGDLVVEIPSSGRGATLSGERRQCRVGT